MLNRNGSIDASDKKPLIEAEEESELNNSKPKYNHSKSDAGQAFSSANNYDDDSDYDYDEQLPYGGKVYLARRKKPDTWLCIAIQVNALDRIGVYKCDLCASSKSSSDCVRCFSSYL